MRLFFIILIPFISSSDTNNDLHKTRTTHMQTYSIYTLNSNKTISHQDRYSLVTLLDDKQVPQRWKYPTSACLAIFSSSRFLIG